jgi:hypothetical protein
LTFCFLMITAAFWALADDFTGNAKLAQKLLVVCNLLHFTSDRIITCHRLVVPLGS